MPSELTIDSQQMTLLSDAEWDTALRSGKWGELSLYYPRTQPVVEAMLRFTRAHSDTFRLALCRDGAFAKTWTVISLLSTQDGWQRVHVERVRCNVCDSTLMIANPTVADLYLGVKDWAEAMRRATASGPVRCVHCHKSLPRFAIWAELKDE